MTHQRTTSSPPQLGPYLLTRRLARSANADVYLAVRPGLSVFSRYLAVKLLRPGSGRASDTFIGSGLSARQLDHANLVRVFDTGAAGDHPYIAMEYVSGRNLRELLVAAGGPLAPATALHIADRLCDALAHIHNATDPQGQALGLLHGAITPRHVLIDQAGNVKLCPVAGAGANGSDRWVDEPAYRPPEQASGGPVDRRTDIFGVGMLLCEMATGHSEPLASSPDTPAQLLAVVGRATAEDPGVRYQRIEALQGDLLEPRQPGAVAGTTRLAELMSRLFPPQADEAGPAPARPPDPPPPPPAPTPPPDTPEPSIVVAEDHDDDRRDNTLVGVMVSAPLLESGAPSSPAPGPAETSYRKQAWAKLERQLMSEIESPSRGRRRLLALLLLAAVGIAAAGLVYLRPGEPRVSGLPGQPPVPATPTPAPPVTTPTPASPVATPLDTPPPAAADAAPLRRAAPAPDAAARPPRSGPRQGRLRMLVTPPVDVRLDDRDLGRTPFVLTVPAGAHRVLLQNRQLGIRLQRKVWVLPDDLTVVRWALGQGTLRVRATAPVKVSVDGVPRGQAPLELQLYQGPRQVRLTDEQGRTTTRRVVIQSGKTTWVDAP